MRVITLGTFDLFHYGHLRLLKKCKKLGNFLIVGLNSDEFVEKYKGKRPVLTYEEREKTLLETGLVDLVVKNEQKDGTIKNIVKRTKPNLIVIGSDWARKDYLKQIGLDWDYLDEKGIWLCYVNYEWSISATELKRRLSA